MRKFYPKGIITTYALIFGAIFLLLLSGLLGSILLQLKQANQKIVWAKALEVAEAGLNYHGWCINNGIEDQCQLEKEYKDILGDSVGRFSLEVESTVSCGQEANKTIISTGWVDEFPNIKRKIKVIYGKESVAKYSYILNENVWVGVDHEIRGPYQSNGGIRMDGENQSLVSSAKEEWLCTSSFGCNPSQMKPGVFTTANGKEDLFSFPVPPFDFLGITMDLAQMKNISQNSGVYLPPSTQINPQAKGYHLKFFDNGSFDVWIITRLSSTYAYSLEEGWHDDYFTITNEYFYKNYQINPACGLVFVEDNLWPEGKVKGKVTLASANLINPNLDTDVVLPGDIEYATLSGSDGLTLIGERNVLIGPQSPNQMELKGIFIAQKGRFSRNHYPNNIRDKLEITGSIISNGRVGTQWISGSQIVSGYLKRESYFDQNLVYNPPCFTPNTTSDFKIISWEEME